MVTKLPWYQDVMGSILSLSCGTDSVQLPHAVNWNGAYWFGCENKQTLSIIFFWFWQTEVFLSYKTKNKKLDTFEISSDILGLHFRYRYSWLYQYFKIFTRRLISKKVFPNRCHITIIDISSPDSRLSVLLNTSRFFVIYKSCNQS